MKKIRTWLFVFAPIGLIFIPFSEVEYYSPNYQAIKVSSTEIKIAKGIPNCNIITQNIYGKDISNLVLCPMIQISTLKLESSDAGTLKVVDDSLFVILKDTKINEVLVVKDSVLGRVDTIKIIKFEANENILVESKEEIDKTYIWFKM
jgi:hypothetical protein